MMDSRSAEEKQLADRVKNMILLSQKHYKPYYTEFLNEVQLSEALDILSGSGVTDYAVWGGYDSADRVMLCVYPPFMQPEPPEYPIECLSVKYRKTDRLTHRDFLGALMSLGIKREVVGDIVVGEGITSFFVKSELAGYIRSQTEKIGRVGVTFSEETVIFDRMVQEYEEHECTVSSLRLDNVVSAALKLSRSKAQSVITGGLVTRNSKITYDCDAKTADGDKISVRGSGKFTIECDGSMTKKGKYKIIVKRLV